MNYCPFCSHILLPGISTRFEIDPEIGPKLAQTAAQIDHFVVSCSNCFAGYHVTREVVRQPRFTEVELLEKGMKNNNT